MDSESVRPRDFRDVMVNEGDSDADDEGIIQGEKGEDVERLGLPKGEDFVRKFRDPKLPSEEEVERHFISGHVPYRSWCGICVRSKGRDMDHVRDGGKGEAPAGIFVGLLLSRG